MPRLAIALIFTLLSTLTLNQAFGSAKPEYLFKVATLAPEGSVWVTQFNAFADEVNEKTNGAVAFRIYTGGIMGDDMAMYRKMRVGQLHGGGFTMTGIASVVPDFRVMAIPFLLRSYDEVDVVRRALLPLFEKRFAETGMEFLAMTEVGFIYPMSTRPIATTTELQKTKSWIPAGDPLAAAFLGNLGITPVQLSIPDVLSSLQTGLIDTVYNSLYGSIVLQWFTRASYVTDAPFGYAYGVFLLDSKRFSKLPAEYAKVLRDSATRYFEALIDETRASNDESRAVLLERGSTFVPAAEQDLQELAQYRERTVSQLLGTSFSQEAYEVLTTALEAHRQKTSQ